MYYTMANNNQILKRSNLYIERLSSHASNAMQLNSNLTFSFCFYLFH